MAGIKQSCLLLLLGVWAGVLLGSCYVDSVPAGKWIPQDPSTSPTYLRLAHYAVSTQFDGRKVYDAVVRLTNVATKVVGSIHYKLVFVAAPSNCSIGHVAYSAEKCLPAGPLLDMQPYRLAQVKFEPLTQPVAKAGEQEVHGDREGCSCGEY
ncbi:hypothetical protein HPB52_002764 [Rhipicephalus sanguineus]|uniref:Cystatin n=1 Tax=Rhipicephalus sanguineus TaxID=34632 RepID=A0A9D4Q9L2_RHISA|nr:hypothetical protein HPB52_002764 [Rhipicephalus sanguineus]